MNPGFCFLQRRKCMFWKRLLRLSSSFCSCPSIQHLCLQLSSRAEIAELRCTTAPHAHHHSCTVSRGFCAGASETASDTSHKQPQVSQLHSTSIASTQCTWTKTGCDTSRVDMQAAQWADVLSKMREEDKQNATQWVQHHTQPCPGCGSRIQKNGGCNHMSCAVCRRQFCWVSRKENKMK